MLAADAAPIVGAAVLLVVLMALWLVANRRHRRRRETSRSEWDDAGGRTDLWTSGARCPHCGQRGGLLEVHDDDLWFVCLSCRGRHRREQRG